MVGICNGIGRIEFDGPLISSEFYYDAMMSKNAWSLFKRFGDDNPTQKRKQTTNDQPQPSTKKKCEHNAKHEG